MPPIPDDQWLALLPEINRIARNVGLQKNASPTVRDRLCSEAVSHVFLKSKLFSPAQGKFAAWCQQVLGNLCVDLIRKEAAARRRFDRYRADVERDQQAAEQAARNPAADPIDTVSSEDARDGGKVAEEATDAATCGADPDNQGIRADLMGLLEQHLEPVDRLLLVTYLGLFDACQSAVVDRWCREACLDHAADFRRVSTLPKRSRKREIATALRKELDWVRTRIYRALVLLKKMGFEEGRP